MAFSLNAHINCFSGFFNSGKFQQNKPFSIIPLLQKMGSKLSLILKIHRDDAAGTDPLSS